MCVVGREESGVGGGGLISNSSNAIDKSHLRCEGGRKRRHCDREERASSSSAGRVHFLERALPVLEIERRLHSNNNSSN